MREDATFFGGLFLVFGGVAFALSFEFKRFMMFDNFTLKYGGLFFALLGIAILLAWVGAKKQGYSDEELGIIRERPRN